MSQKKAQPNQTQTNNKALAIRKKEDSLSRDKQDGFNFDFGYDRLGETMKICESIAQSGMVPREYQNASKKVLVAAAMGARFGLDPLQSLQSIAVVNGSPTFYGDALLGMVKNSPEHEWTLEGVKAMEFAMEESPIYKKWLDHYECKPSKIAFCVTKRVGEDAVIQHYTIDQAKEGGLLNKDNWKKNPVRMLQMRARSFALRDAFPDVLKGYKTYEEMRDVEDDKVYDHEPLPESTGEFVDEQDWEEETEEQEEEVASADFDDVEEVIEEEEAEDVNEAEEGDGKKSRLTSMDMGAEDAIEQIRIIDSMHELLQYLDEKEDRVTVQRAYQERAEELNGANTEAPAEVEPEPETEQAETKPQGVETKQPAEPDMFNSDGFEGIESENQ